ncbi:MAG TPA: TlpA disulfide reductase family protein [Hyphomonadaceae bacterium]|jgi:thiol-disulfide isomerase/thioredoxin|nr:TlpA disulfide reductase family protein [Hyphomonadaceae bacterium]
MTLKPAFAAALLALFATACQPEKAASDGAMVADASGGGAGKSAPDIKSFAKGEFEKLSQENKGLPLPPSPFVNETGAVHSFADYKGKVVVYNVWAEWCGPCVEEMPTLVKLQEAFAGKDVVVIPVANGYAEARDSAHKKFLQLTGGALPFFYDDKYDVNADAKTGNFPTTLIYDKSGKEVVRLDYPAKWDSPEAVALVQAVLDGAT